MKRGLLFLLALGLLVVAALVGGPVLERNRRAAEMSVLRGALEAARSSADSCVTALVREEEAFRAFDRRVDSLRAEVDGFQDPERGGVPQELYREYLRAFNLYNERVEEWEARADTLRGQEARCRSLVDRHNELGDSIAGLREEWSG